VAHIKSKLKEIESLLPQIMANDRLPARREIQRLTRAKPKAFPDNKLGRRLERLEKRVAASVRRKSIRKLNLPKLHYNDELPITAKKDDIIKAISKHPVIIVLPAGESTASSATPSRVESRP
jgi:ATP-dependent helicase HrpA